MDVSMDRIVLELNAMLEHGKKQGARFAQEHDGSHGPGYQFGDMVAEEQMPADEVVLFKRIIRV